MSSISKLHEVDPTFREVVAMLYGDSVDPRQLWDIAKSMPAGSDMHVPGMGGTPEEKQTKKRKLLAGGLVLGTAAEGTATAEATKNAYNAFKKPVVPNIPKAADHIGKVPKVAGELAEHGGGKGKAAAAGMLALQATNMGVGLASARELTKKPQKTGVNKKLKTLYGVSKPIVRLSRPEQQAIIAHSQRTAKTIRRNMVGGATVGGAAGAYIGTKRYNLKRYNGQPTPVADTVKAVGTDVKNVGRKAKSYGKGQVDAVKQTHQANKDQVTKADTYTWEGTISKVDTDKRLVFGWCSLSKVNGEPVVDLQGDYIPIEETEAAAYRYVIESRKGGDMHKRVSKFNMDEPLHTADLVESMVITPEKLKKMGLAEDALPHGWWIGMKVNDDDQWQAVKKGERLGFSVHGKGRREEREL